jgi:hypothetical protein
VGHEGHTPLDLMAVYAGHLPVAASEETLADAVAAAAIAVQDIKRRFKSTIEDEDDDDDYSCIIRALYASEDDIKETIGSHAIAAVLGGQVLYGLTFVTAAVTALRDGKWIDELAGPGNRNEELAGEVECSLPVVLTQTMIVAKPAMMKPGNAWMCRQGRNVIIIPLLRVCFISYCH